MDGLSSESVEFGKGKIYVVATKRGVSRIFFGQKAYKEYLKSLGVKDIPEGGDASKFARELRKYLSGRLSKFKARLDISQGTAFEKSVWKKLLDVPYGEVVTYQDLAIDDHG